MDTPEDIARMAHYLRSEMNDTPLDDEDEDPTPPTKYTAQRALEGWPGEEEEREFMEWAWQMGRATVDDGYDDVC